MWTKNSTLLFSGRLLSTTGDSLYQVAVIWYIYVNRRHVLYWCGDSCCHDSQNIECVFRSLD